MVDTAKDSILTEEMWFKTETTYKKKKKQIFRRQMWCFVDAWKQEKERCQYVDPYATRPSADRSMTYFIHSIMFLRMRYP